MSLSFKARYKILKRLLSDTPGSIKRVTYKYTKPELMLLNEYPDNIGDETNLSHILETKLNDFGVYGSVEKVIHGPLITRYDVKLSSGIKFNQLKNIENDLAISLRTENIRISPVPSTDYVGIEVPRTNLRTVGLRSVLEGYKDKFTLPIGLGVDIVGKPKFIDLVKMPHLLIAGQTGSGKSVCINSIILSLLFLKDLNLIKLYLIDPKRVELSNYRGLPNVEVITELEDAYSTFNELVNIMEQRYKLFTEFNVRNIESYNELRGRESMEYIICIVDEMADLMMKADDSTLENNIVRLAQLSRATGIHLILATQKPISDVITGLIKSNIPGRVAFRVSSAMDSRVILDRTGAERLIGRGDMLTIYPGIFEPIRLHGAWVSDHEIHRVVTHITKRG